MRLVFFGNNNVAVEVLRYLRTTKHEVVGLVVHPEENGKRIDELISISGLDAQSIFLGNLLRKKQTLEALSALKPDMGVSVFFGYIFRKKLLSLFPRGCVNLHPALLPYNRGAYPNVWSIVDGTPAGATLHLIDIGVDTGDVIANKKTPVRPWDTGKTLYERLERTCVELFLSAWPGFVSGELKPMRQEELGTSHKTWDVNGIDEIDMDKEYKASELIDILRARTFPPHRGAYFVHKDKRIYVSVNLEPDFDDSNGDGRDE